MNSSLNRYKLVLIIVLLLAVSFGCGVYFGKSTKYNNIQNNIIVGSTSSTQYISTTTANMDAFWETWNILSQKFVYTHKDAKKISDQDKVWGAIQGLTAVYGDPYTVFMPPEESKAFAGDISGNFEGVGMELAIKDKNIVVVAPLKGTPAYNAGVQKGDVVLAIDGKNQ